MQPGMWISYVARRHGLSPSLVFRWRRLMSEGGSEAVGADEVVPAAELRRLEEQVRELFRAVAARGMPERFAQRLRGGIGPDSPVPEPLSCGRTFCPHSGYGGD